MQSCSYSEPRGLSFIFSDPLSGGGKGKHPSGTVLWNEKKFFGPTPTIRYDSTRGHTALIDVMLLKIYLLSSSSQAWIITRANVFFVFRLEANIM